MKQLDGKVAIVTGGARGQGAATAALFVERGATVHLTDVDLEAGREAAASSGASFHHHDVSSRVSWEQLVSRVVSESGRVDVLVNNAGIIEWKTMAETSPEVWDRTIAVNQTGPLLGMQAVAPHMCEQRAGSIINVSSVGGLSGASACFAYGATKWALRGMSRSAAQELGPYGVRVNAVLPGYVESRMIAGLDHEAVLGRIPLGRIADPLDIARASAWLASDDNSYANGAELVIDGGSRA